MARDRLESMPPSLQGALPPLRRTRAFENICKQIRQRLVDGALKPGDKLPSENELAAEFQVSRPAVREALRTLEISGVVTIREGAHGGAFICEGDPGAVSNAIADLIVLGHLSLDNVMQARAEMGRMIVRLACACGTEADFAAIEDNIRRIDRLNAESQLAERAEASVEFFHLLARGTGNMAFVVLVDALNRIVRPVVYGGGIVAMPELTATRLRILAALRDRDAEAAVDGIDALLTAIAAELNEHHPRSQAHGDQLPSAGVH